MQLRTTMLAGVLLAILTTGTASAKNYSVDNILVTATVHSDGTVVMDEAITYTFQGSYSFAWRDIPLKPGEEITDVRVYEAGHDFIERSGEAPGTFEVRRSKSNVRVTWYYHASDESRTFDFSYVARGVVKRHPDVAEFYHQFVGNGWDRPIGKAKAVVGFERPVYGSDIRAWAHGPLDGNVKIESTGKVVMTVAPLPAHRFWEGRIVFDPALVPGAPEGASTPQMDAIMAEEAQWVRDANVAREVRQRRFEAWAKRQAVLKARAGRYLPISVFLGVVALVLWFAAWRKYGKPHGVMSHVARGDMPSDHPPAVVSYLLYRQIGATAIVATLVDLADRGYFNIREEQQKSSSWFGTRTKTDYIFERTDKLWSDLAPWELELAEFLITEVGDMDHFTMLQLGKTARKQRRQFVKWFRQWIASVKEAGKSCGFYEPYPAAAMWRNALTGIGVAAVGFFFSGHSGSPAGLPAIIGGFITAVLTVTLSRRTIEGQRLAKGWRDFKTHLGSVSRGLGPVTLDSHAWARYLGIAIIFGLHKKLIPKITPVDGNGAVYYPAWYAGTMPGDGAAGLSGFADGISSMVSSVTSTMSSASGTGGGATGGGGGGSGGGGGGAG